MVAILEVLAKLAELYLRIDYGPYGTNKTHANLAAHYLTRAIKEVLPQNRPDVLMQGVRLLSHHAQCCIEYGGADHIPEVTERIAEIALVGIVREDHFPVTVCTMEELGKLSRALLTSRQKYDLRFPLHELRGDIQNIALLLLKNTKDSALGNRHSQALAGYYSATSQSGFLAMLSELAKLMQSGQYTELFFLDEATALAAGHRPCAECRRERYKSFLAAWPVVGARAGDVDAILKRERVNEFRLSVSLLGNVSDGVIVKETDSGSFYLLNQGSALQWTFGGYSKARSIEGLGGCFIILTPASTVEAFRNGYRPDLHPSALS